MLLILKPRERVLAPARERVINCRAGCFSDALLLDGYLMQGDITLKELGVARSEFYEWYRNAMKDNHY